MRIFYLFLFTIGIIACKEQEEILVENVIEAPTITYQNFLVTVNDLRLRSAPDLKSEVVDKLKEGTMVNGENQVSENIDTITLRGHKKIAPYYYIKTENGKEGWAYGGALELIYSGTEPSPFTARFGNAIIAMRNLNKSDKNANFNLINIVDEYKGADPIWNDALLVLAEKYRDEIPLISESVTEGLAWTEEDYQAIRVGNYDMNTDKITSYLFQNGYRLRAVEGIIWPEVDGSFIAKKLKGPFTVPMQSYQDIMLKAEEKPILDDGSIAVPVMQIAEIFVALEKHNKDFPTFAFNKNVKQKLAFFKSLLLDGTDNSPAIDRKTKTFKEPFLDAYRYVLETHPETSISIDLQERI